MKILFVTSMYPEDIQMSTAGIFQRMKMFMEALNDIASLDVLFYVHPTTDISASRAIRMEKLLQEYWRCNASVFLCRGSQNTTVNIPTNFPFGEWLKDWWLLHPYCYWAANHEHLIAFEKCLERKPDAVFVHRLNSIYPVFLSQKVTQPVFFDLDDIEHKAFVRNMKQPPFWRSKFLQYLKVPSLLWLESRAISMAKKTFVCSESDRNYLIKKFHQPSVVTIPNAIDIPPLYESPASPTFLFLGTYKHPPNVVAAEFLINKIWPTVKHEVPDARLIIAGQCPENIKCFHGKNDGVEYRGFVDDLDILYRQTRVICCPVLSGSGTRIKIIEAAAYGKAIVSTTLGAEGLDYVDGYEIMLRDDDTTFAQACIDLCKDISLNNQIGKAAREKATKLYSRNNSKNRIISEVKNCV